jgi:hypothetical protein
VKRIDRRLIERCGMNFARFKCDRRAAQSLMRDDAFALQFRNGGGSVLGAISETKD